MKKSSVYLKALRVIAHSKGLCTETYEQVRISCHLSKEYDIELRLVPVHKLWN